MEEAVESVDECVSCLSRPVIDLLTLRSVVTRLSTNWEQLKLSMRERGLLREGSSSPPPPHDDGDMEVEGKDTAPDCERDLQSDRQESADQTAEPLPGDCQTTDQRGTSADFIGPVLPTTVATETANHGVQSTLEQSEVTETSTGLEVEHGNGNMETLESATVQTSDVVSTETSYTTPGEEYQKIECAVLYWHKTSGYIYDPVNQQFYAPASSYYGQQASSTDQSGQSSLSYATALSTQGGVSNYDAGQTSQTSISDILAAASDRVMERCGLEYDETAGMYFDANSALYYDQESKLYYDPDLGSYYHYDKEKKTYTLHSRVQLPELQMRKKKKEKEVEIILVSEDEFNDSPEEGEIRGPKKPKIPRGSPPPEEEWAPCIRMLVSESKSLSKGTLFLVTQDGASVGREPTGAHGIKVPELQVSKSHATISYDRREGHFTITDHGSTNGTFVNEERLSEPKQKSKPHPLSHGQTLTLGSTTFSIHIHIGWETCAWCDPAQWGALQPPDQADEVGEEVGGSLDLQRRKELNRIKKRYGLRVKDTYGDKEVKEAEGYSDRAHKRRKTVGSQPPDFHRPDDAPSSVHRAISTENVGHKMLKKLGWKEGEGLGKGGVGVAEPIKADIRDSKAGLGSGPIRSMDSAGDPACTNSASGRAHKMRQRFDDAVSRELEKKKRELLQNLDKKY